MANVNVKLLLDAKNALIHSNSTISNLLETVAVLHPGDLNVLRINDFNRREIIRRIEEALTNE